MARAGQKVKLECEAGGDPIPELSWSHDGKRLEETKYKVSDAQLVRYI